ncbi:DUF5131 family protein [Archangium violaceum]|uniref:DUF5131 family protein n=1 Tax=Archangium violaceum TaxID=83451 RepID=UPI00193AF063|nr:DUF5131 family protein [Archangium violaceum]QRK06031.1 DUF5131 family protein [Archangium violaceum]
MAENSSIEWTHHTFNPWRGCSKVHAGCTNCYAEKNQGVAMQGITWGEVWQGGQRVVKAESGWREPLKWARDAARAGERRRVFCASLADLLEVPETPVSWPSGWGVKERNSAIARLDHARADLDTARERLWDVIRETARMPLPLVDDDLEREGGTLAIPPTPGLDWLLLTKRPENWRLVPEDTRPFCWLGTSISDQKTADEWAWRLCQAQGFRLRFLSIEPLTGFVDLWAFRSLINWVIVGGESGPKARPCDVEWVRDIVRQCRKAGVPCFVKQLGAITRWDLDAPMPPNGLLTDRKGGDMSEWPEDLRVREFPEVQS